MMIDNNDDSLRPANVSVASRLCRFLAALVLVACLFPAAPARAMSFEEGLAKIQGQIDEALNTGAQLEKDKNFEAAQLQYVKARELLRDTVNQYVTEKWDGLWITLKTFGYDHRTELKLDKFLGMAEEINHRIRHVEVAWYGDSFGRIRDGIEKASDDAQQAMASGNWSAATDAIDRATQIFEEGKRQTFAGAQGSVSGARVFAQVFPGDLMGTLNAQKRVASRMLVETQMQGYSDKIAAATAQARAAADRKDFVTAAEKFQLVELLYAGAVTRNDTITDRQLADQAWANTMEAAGAEVARSELDGILRKAVEAKIQPVFIRVRELITEASRLMVPGPKQDFARGMALQEQAAGLSASAQALINTPRASASIILTNMDLTMTPEALLAQLNAAKASVSTVSRTVTIDSVQFGNGPAIEHKDEKVQISNPGGRARTRADSVIPDLTDLRQSQ